MTNNYAVVASSGAITSIYSTTKQFISCGDEVRDDLHYYDHGSQQIKPKSPYTYSQDVDGLSVTLTGLPSGVTVSTNGASGQVGSVPMTIMYDIPGTYLIEISGGVEFLDESLEVSVGDP